MDMTGCVFSCLVHSLKPDIHNSSQKTVVVLLLPLCQAALQLKHRAAHAPCR